MFLCIKKSFPFYEKKIFPILRSKNLLTILWIKKLRLSQLRNFCYIKWFKDFFFIKSGNFFFIKWKRFYNGKSAMSFFLYRSGNEAEKKFKFFFHKMVGFYELKIFFDFIQKKSLRDFLYRGILLTFLFIMSKGYHAIMSSIEHNNPV